ncbi:MAG: hypothetical protein IMF07_07895 [Proteobacteria bacterium]|nr:hypothetical protein [Pseudomonadota bacterium]
MNRFMKFLLLGLLLAPLITGCTSTRFTSTMKNQEFQNTEGVKFNIETVSLEFASAREMDNIAFIREQGHKANLARELIMAEAEKSYPELFVAEGDVIPLELNISLNSSNNQVDRMPLIMASLATIPVPTSIYEDIAVDLKVRDESNKILFANSSKFRQETGNWTTAFSPFGLIPVPGKSDIPKLTRFGPAPGLTQRGSQFLRRSIVNSIVKTLKDSDMQKMVASYKRSRRFAEANRRLEERLLQGASSSAMDQAMAKQPLVLMPLRASGIAAANRPAMESAIASGLSNRYKVYFGKRVADTVREIYTKATAEAKAGEECDDTMCMQNIGISFQSELVASANVVRNPSGYMLTLNVTNVFDDVVVMSESVPCKGCDEFQVVERLKTLSEI